MRKLSTKEYMKRFNAEWGKSAPIEPSSSSDDSDDSETEQEGIKRRCIEDDNDESSCIDVADKEIKLKDKLPSIRRKTLKLKVNSEQSYLEHVEEKVDSFITCDQSWAKTTKEKADSDQEEEEVPTASHPTQNLKPSTLNYKREFDLNHNQRNKEKRGYVQSLQFHPTEPLALVASRVGPKGDTGYFVLFKVDGKSNPQVDCLNFKEFPLDCARFTPDGNTILFGTKFRNYYLTYDIHTRTLDTHQGPLDGGEIKNMRKFEISPDGKLLVSANHGNLYFISLKSRELLASRHQNSDVRAIQFSPNGSLVFTHGAEGKVRIWDLNNFSIQHTFKDRAALCGNAIAFTPDSHYLALGSDRGVVNLYEAKQALANSAPEPVKVFNNLTTHISAVSFNCTGKILGFVSEYKDEAVRLAHTDSLTVYQNFPLPRKEQSRFNSLAFSPGSGYLALGTKKGHVNLFRLNHYDSY